MTFAAVCIPIEPGRLMVDDAHDARRAVHRVGAEVTGLVVTQHSDRLLIVGVRSDEEFDALAWSLRRALPPEFTVVRAEVEVGEPRELVIHAALRGAGAVVDQDEAGEQLELLGWRVTHHYAVHVPGVAGMGVATPMVLARFPLTPPAPGRDWGEVTDVSRALDRVNEVVDVLDYVVTNHERAERKSTARQLFTLELDE